MSFAIFAYQSDIDEIEHARVRYRFSFDNGDTGARGDYLDLLRRILGDSQAKMIFNGKAHLRPILSSSNPNQGNQLFELPDGTFVDPNAVVSIRPLEAVPHYLVSKDGFPERIAVDYLVGNQGHIVIIRGEMTEGVRMAAWNLGRRINAARSNGSSVVTVTAVANVGSTGSDEASRVMDEDWKGEPDL